MARMFRWMMRWMVLSSVLRLFRGGRGRGGRWGGPRGGGGRRPGQYFQRI